MDNQQNGSNGTDSGNLKIQITSEIGAQPIEDAVIEISYTGEPDRVIEKVKTNSSGFTETINLKAPPIEYSLEPGNNQPYSEYTLKISAPEYSQLTISGTQILPSVLALQNAKISPLATSENEYPIVIDPHTLYGDFPPKIAEEEIKPIDESGEIVLSRVVVPEYIVVHDGAPTDNTATNHYVKYKDYIKNVASCEIYATWPQQTIEANILAMMSFTLNRVYTEW